jgi:alpha-beta hydrolase superfamily lysophospholipase
MASVSSLAPGALAPSRVSFAFSPDGATAACLHAGSPEAPLRVEVLRFSGDAARSELVFAGPLHLGLQLQPLDDGRLLLCDGAAGEIRVADSPPCVLARLRAQGARLVAPPAASDAVSFATTYHGEGRSTIWRLDPDGGTHELATLPGALGGGVWLDLEGKTLALDRHDESGGCEAVVVDLTTGEWRSLLSVSPTSHDRIVAFGSRSGVLVVSTDATGEARLGYGVPGREQIGFPPALHRAGRDTSCLGLDDVGGRVVVSEEDGAVSRLSVLDIRSGRRRELVAPAGTVNGPARIVDGALRVAWTAPDTPATVATVDLDGSGFAVAHTHGPWAPGRVATLDGADGPIEAIVYGDPARARRVVLALHGGPLAAWRLGFEGLFQSLAAAGVAVVAPNQRGSTGYGPAHAAAIHGAWGGPDLADVLAIARGLRVARAGATEPRPVLLGTSYGAFLALLAAAAEPDAAAGAVAIAPFVSATALHDVASAPVRRLLERQDALALPDDELGPRDLVRLAPHFAAPVLLLHGAQDDVIPVSQTRALAAALERAQRDVRVHVLEGEGHEPAAGRARARVHELVTDFCSTAGKAA